MTATADISPSAAAAWLRQGQALEAASHFSAAVDLYDRVIASVNGSHLEPEPDRGRLLGLAWMNRGNALQKMTSEALGHDAIHAYDRAIAIFEIHPCTHEAPFRNHLGAAWLNRGHALLVLGNPDATGSFEAAIACFEELHLEADLHYRLNLAGAWTNLAHALLSPHRQAFHERSRSASGRALEVLAPVESAHEAFGAMSLRARHARVMALGELLAAAEQSGDHTTELAAEATDAIEDGLAIAHEFEQRGVTQLRPLAARLFQLGAQLYAQHQPQFLDEFVLEHLAHPVFGADPELHTIAHAALSRALQSLQQPRILIAGRDDTEKLLSTARSLRAARHQLSLSCLQRPTPTT